MNNIHDVKLIKLDGKNIEEREREREREKKENGEELFSFSSWTTPERG